MLLKTELLLGELGLLVVAPRLQPLFADLLDGGEQGGLDLVDALGPGRRQADADGEQRVALVATAHAGGETVGQTGVAQDREQAAFAFMAEQVGEEVGGLVTVVLERIRHREHEAHMAAVAHRLQLHMARQRRLVDQRLLDHRALQAAIGDIGEALGHHCFQLVQRLRTHQRQVHDVGVVVALVELDHPLAQGRLAGGRVGQGLTAAHREARGGVGGIEHLIEHVVLTAAIVADARHVFGVHDVALALQLIGVEQRREEELAEAIQSAGQRGGFDLEEVVGVLRCGEGVVAAAVTAQIALVGIGFGEGLGAEEQHVLEEVRQPGQIVRILGAAHADVHRGGGAVGRDVADQQCSQAVLERQHPVVAIVMGADVGLDDLLDGRFVVMCRFLGLLRLGQGRKQQASKQQAGKPGQRATAWQSRMGLEHHVSCSFQRNMGPVGCAQAGS